MVAGAITGDAVHRFPDVSRPETKLWFYFLAASFIDLGIEAIHFGQVELMNGNDRDLTNYSQVLDLIRSHAAKHARRHMILCDAHVPRGGFVRDGRLLMDFHSFPLRIMEVPDRPQEAVLKVGFSDGLYGRSRGVLHSAAGRASTCPISSRSTTGESAGSPVRRIWGASGSGVMTRSPGLPIKAKNIVPTGSLCRGTGCGELTAMATFKCPAAARCDRRWTTSDGTMRTIRVLLYPKVSATRRRFARSGRRMARLDSFIGKAGSLRAFWRNHMNRGICFGLATIVLSASSIAARSRRNPIL